MAKITLKDGSIIEGTIEELKQMGVKFPVEEEPVVLKVGDYILTLCDSKFGFMRQGTVGVITDTDIEFDDEYSVIVNKLNLHGKYISDDGALFRLQDLAKASEKEVAEAKRQLEENDLSEKWAKIGRKPNEFKVGDAIQYKKAFTVVTGIKPGGIIAINQSNHISKNVEVNPEDLTLVFPAEAKFG
jgi:hypothetical protein